MRTLRIAASVLDLAVLALTVAVLGTLLTVPGSASEPQWEHLALVLLPTAALASLVCLRPWTQFRRQPPAPVVPMVAVVLNIGFALCLGLAMVRAGEALTARLVVKALLPFALVVGFNLAALGFRFAHRVPAWLWTAAVLPTAAWAALYGWPQVFAGLLYGVRPDG